MVLRASMTCTCPFFSHGFWGKVCFITRIEFLWDHVSKVRVPKSNVVSQRHVCSSFSELVQWLRLSSWLYVLRQHGKQWNVVQHCFHVLALISCC